VARRDKETSGTTSKPIDRKLAARLESVLRAARAATKEDAKRKGGRWLALVPVTVALLSFALMMPRATDPESVPLPNIDERVLVRVKKEDDARAKDALAQRLPTDALAIGSGIRMLLTASAEDDAQQGRLQLAENVRQVFSRAGGTDDILKLRALQTHTFVAEVARFEATGEQSEELRGLAGEFVEKMRAVNWIIGNRVLLDEWQRRIAFKAMWTRLTGLELEPAFKLTLDEERVLYALYIRRPHPPELRRGELDALRRSATDQQACTRAAIEENRATQMWLVDKIKLLAQIDPTYPAEYALGVAYFKAGRFDLATDAFRTWIDRHPDGAYSVRARNHLKASLATYGTL
jgi:hypothetical protein